MPIYDDPKNTFRDIASIVDRIDREGAVTVAAIDPCRALDIHWAAMNLPFVPQAELVSRGRVRQQVEICDAFPDYYPMAIAARKITAELSEAFSRLDPSPFATPFEPNDVVLQRYPAGSVGITPHHDGISRINLVCVLVVSGDGTFRLHDDRNGTNPREIFAPPGHLILMKAPGFRGTERGPFHSIANIVRGRLILGIRQRLHSPRS